MLKRNHHPAPQYGRSVKTGTSSQSSGVDFRIVYLMEKCAGLYRLSSEMRVPRLLEIEGTGNPHRGGDVVFVHGLDGDAIGSWHPPESPEALWPRWLGQDLPRLGIWSLAYEATSSEWKGSAMPLVDRATNVLALLEAKNLGQHPIVFIAHSLGGLLVKQMLRHAVEYGSDKWARIGNNTVGIVFLATPHSGSSVATWLDIVGGAIGATAAIRDLRAHSPYLRDLNNWFRNVSGVQCQVYIETRKSGPVRVVNEESADPGINGVIPIPLDADHVNMCKLHSRDELLFIRSRQFLEELLLTTRGAGTRLEVSQDEGLRSGPASVYDYLYTDMKRISSYSEQCKVPFASPHSAVLQLVEVLKPESEIAPLADNKTTSDFGLMRCLARRVCLPKKFLKTVETDDLRMWIVTRQVKPDWTRDEKSSHEVMCMIEDCPIPDREHMSRFSGYTTFQLMLHELRHTDRRYLGERVQTGESLTLEISKKAWSSFRHPWGRMRMLRRVLGVLPGIPSKRVSIRSSQFHHNVLELKILCDGQHFDIHITLNTQNGDAEGGDSYATLRLVRNLEREFSIAFWTDPIASLSSWGAVVGDERLVDIFFRVRYRLHDGIVGYPIAIATAPSSLILQ
jgi:hypothetical protein